MSCSTDVQLFPTAVKIEIYSYQTVSTLGSNYYDSFILESFYPFLLVHNEILANNWVVSQVIIVTATSIKTTYKSGTWKQSIKPIYYKSFFTYISWKPLNTFICQNSLVGLCYFVMKTYCDNLFWLLGLLSVLLIMFFIGEGFPSITFTLGSFVTLTGIN